MDNLIFGYFDEITLDKQIENEDSIMFSFVDLKKKELNFIFTKETKEIKVIQ